MKRWWKGHKMTSAARRSEIEQALAAEPSHWFTFIMVVFSVTDTGWVSPSLGDSRFGCSFCSMWEGLFHRPRGRSIFDWMETRTMMLDSNLEDQESGPCLILRGSKVRFDRASPRCHHFSCCSSSCIGASSIMFESTTSSYSSATWMRFLSRNNAPSSCAEWTTHFFPPALFVFVWMWYPSKSFESVGFLQAFKFWSLQYASKSRWKSMKLALIPWFFNTNSSLMKERTGGSDVVIDNVFQSVTGILLESNGFVRNHSWQNAKNAFPVAMLQAFWTGMR